MRGCSGTGEYEAGKEKISVYSLQKTRLHHCYRPSEQTNPVTSHAVVLQDGIALAPKLSQNTFFSFKWLH